jgi:ribonuclease P protein component
MIDADFLKTESPRRVFLPAFRFHAAKDFSRVFAARSKFRGKYFDLHYLACDTELAGSARLGLVVAKKLARYAVQRNLLKRLAREAFRHTRGRLPPYDLVLRLARPPGNIQGSESETAANMRRLWRTDIDQLLDRLIERSSFSSQSNPQNKS